MRPEDVAIHRLPAARPVFTGKRTFAGALLGAAPVAFGAYGVLALFVLAVLFTILRWPRSATRDASRELVWGIGLPFLCLLFDPFVFRRGMDVCTSLAQVFAKGFHPYPVTMLAYAAIGLNMGVFGASLCGWTRSRRAFAAGWLAGGAILAAAIGVFLAPFSALGTVFAGVGLLGFTPFFTAWYYGRRALRELRQSAGEPRTALERRLSLALGLVSSALVPLLMSWRSLVESLVGLRWF